MLSVRGEEGVEGHGCGGREWERKPLFLLIDAGWDFFLCWLKLILDEKSGENVWIDHNSLSTDRLTYAYFIIETIKRNTCTCIVYLCNVCMHMCMIYLNSDIFIYLQTYGQTRSWDLIPPRHSPSPHISFRSFTVFQGKICIWNIDIHKIKANHESIIRGRDII